MLHTAYGWDAAKAVVEEIQTAGGVAEPICADLGSPDAGAQLFDEVEMRLGAADILVNNAAHCEAADTALEINPGLLIVTLQ